MLIFFQKNTVHGSQKGDLQSYIRYLSNTKNILSKNVLDIGQDLLIKSTINYVNNDYDTSYALSQEALKIIPQLSSTHFLIAKTADIIAPHKYQNTKQKLAIDHMKIAIELAGDLDIYKIYYYHIINIYTKKNKYDQAALIFEKMISKFPPSIQDLQNLKKLYILSSNELQAKRVNNQIDSKES